MTSAPLFHSWLDDFFAGYYRHLPVNATFIGHHEHDHALPDWSKSGQSDFLNDIQRLQHSLQRLPHETLSPIELIDRKVAAGFLRLQHDELSSNHFHNGNPALYSGEAIFAVMGLFLRDFAEIEDRSEAAVARMQAIPAFLEEARSNIRSSPLAWIERAQTECRGAALFFTGGIDRLLAAHQLPSDALRPAADAAAKAFAAYSHWMESDLKHRGEKAAGAGADALELAIRQAHFLPQDSTELLRQAQNELSSRRAALEEGAAAFGTTSWQDALSLLANEHPEDSQSYYRQYQETWDACRALVEEHDLVTWKTLPIRYIPRPLWAREAAKHLYFLFYRSPAPFDNTVPVDYLVEPIEPDLDPQELESKLRALNNSVIKLNHVVHHGALGHHVQNTVAFSSESRVGKMAAVDCASRIALLAGGTMAEGWSCYTTELVAEYGFLTQLEAYSEHYARLRMAARSIVDIQLHRGELSFDDAVAFYEQSVHLSPTAARSEATKNSMFPGGALMYLSGTEAIHRLRRAVKSSQGDDFRLGRFHDELLSYGSLPIPLIAEAMLPAE